MARRVEREVGIDLHFRVGLTEVLMDAGDMPMSRPFISGLDRMSNHEPPMTGMSRRLMDDIEIQPQGDWKHLSQVDSGPLSDISASYVAMASQEGTQTNVGW